MVVPDMAYVLCAAFAGGWLGRACRIPGGTLIGATVMVAVTVNLAGISGLYLRDFLFVLQVMIGCMLGQTINRRFGADILTIWRPTLLYLLGFTAAALPFAAGLMLLCGFEPFTAVLAATPARLQDMVILAESADSDSISVMFLQMARQFCIIGVTPLVLGRYLRQQKTTGQAVPKAKMKFSGITPGKFAVLFTPAIVGAFVGRHTGHPLGPMLCALLFVGISRVISLRAGEIPFPKFMVFFVQSCAGLLLGSRITSNILDLLASRLLPLGLSLVYILGVSLLFAKMLERRHNWNPALSWMAAAPGRTSDMLAISHDIAMTPHERLALVTMHTMRQLYFTALVSVIVLAV